MNVTFLVTINLDSLDTLQDVATDIEDKISTAYEVKEVRPWARPRTIPQPITPLTLTDTTKT